MIPQRGIGGKADETGQEVFPWHDQRGRTSTSKAAYAAGGSARGTQREQVVGLLRCFAYRGATYMQVWERMPAEPPIFPGTVSARLHELERDGVVVRGGTALTPMGRKAKLYYLKEYAPAPGSER